MDSPAQIDCCHSQRFVHRHDEVPCSIDSTAVADGRRYRLAECDPDVFDGVMLVDVQISCGSELQIECAMPRKQLEHVVEKSNSGADVVAPFAVNRKTQQYLRLRR